MMCDYRANLLVILTKIDMIYEMACCFGTLKLSAVRICH
jgi:hypothetical protein